MVIIRLPRGTKFRPSDKQLAVDYLQRKLKGEPLPSNFVKDCCHIYGKKNPWEVFDKNSDDYFYCFTKLTKRSENRVDRTAGSCGTWKGQHTRTAKSADGCVEWCKKDFVFETTDHSTCRDHANGHWLMQEYSLLNQREDDFVLCRIRNNAKGQRKKKQGTAPYNLYGDHDGIEVVFYPSAEEIQCNHEVASASTSDLATEGEGDVQIQHQSKKMRASSSNVEGVVNGPVNVDGVATLNPQPPLSEERPPSNQFYGQELAMLPMSEESQLTWSVANSFNLGQDLMFMGTNNCFNSGQDLMFMGTNNCFNSGQDLMFMGTNNCFNSGQDLTFMGTTNSFFPSISSLPFNPYFPTF